MSSISVDYDVLNQKGSPAWYSDTFANIPTPGYKGRMFISTDTFAFYRDNGTGWDLVGGPGTGTITGAGVTGQVTFFSGTDTISGNTNLIWDNTNKRLGINTATPGVSLDVHATTGVVAQFENTTTNNTLLSFRNQGAGYWSIGNNYSGGINDFIIYDAVSFSNRLTIKNTGVTTLIGTFTATSLIKSGGTSSQILLADGSTTPTSTFGAGSVTNVSALTIGTTGVDLTSSVANSTTTPVITLNVPTASATNRGALSSADWTTFNSKQATITLTTTGTSGAATLVGATLNIPNYTNVGTVTSVAALTLGTTGTDLSSSVANSTSTPVITLNVPTASATNRGALSSADWTTFNNKQATISVTAPVVLTGATISMPAATTSVSGYLTSTDWNTFNNKTSNLGTVTDVVALTIGTTGIDITSTAVTTTTTPVITLNIPTASASNRGALSSTDWTTFNNKQATLSLTTTGTSGAATLVANTLNIPNYGSALSGYVPYTGATTNVALGTNSLSGSSFTANGTSGAFIGVTINNTDATGSSRLRITSTGSNVTDIISYSASHPSRANQSWLGGDSSSTTTVLQSGGVEFLRGLSSGVATFSNYILTENSILIKTGFNTSTSGYTGIGAVATGLTINLGTGTTGSLLFNTGASYSYTFPAATGTLALTSDLGGYLPLSGGTLTGNLNGTSASFSNGVTITSDGAANCLNLKNRVTDDYTFFNWKNYSGAELLAEQYIQRTAANTGIMRYTINNGSTPATYLTIASTGAATFSSTILATNSTFTTTGSPATNGNFAGLFVSSSSSLRTDGIGIGDRGSALNKWVQSYNGALELNPVGNNVLIGSGSNNFGKLDITVTPSSYTAALGLGLQTDSGEGNSVGISFKTKVSLSGTIFENARIAAFTDAVSSSAYGALAFYTMTATTLSERMRIGNNGFFGFGTSSASSFFDIVAGTNANFATPAIKVSSSTGGAGGATILQINHTANSVSGLQISQYGATPGNYTAIINTENSYMLFGTNNTERYRITAAGINNYTSRGNYLGATDNSLFSLNSGGTLYTVGFSPTATASSTNTLTLTTGQTTYIYTGTGTATWTLPNPSGTNQMFWIKNAGTGIITLNAFAGTNIINNAAASVSSITIAIGATALIQQDGNVKSYQLQ